MAGVPGVLHLVRQGVVVPGQPQVSAVDLGYETENISMFSLSHPGASYETPEAGTLFFETLERELAAVPGELSVGAVYGAPLGVQRVAGAVMLRDRPDPAPGQTAHVSFQSFFFARFESQKGQVRHCRGRAA